MMFYDFCFADDGKAQKYQNFMICRVFNLFFAQINRNKNFRKLLMESIFIWCRVFRAFLASQKSLSCCIFNFTFESFFAFVCSSLSFLVKRLFRIAKRKRFSCFSFVFIWESHFAQGKSLTIFKRLEFKICQNAWQKFSFRNLVTLM